MTNYVGGIRLRLIQDSIHYMLEDTLTSLGWFDSGRQHSPILFTVKPIDEGTEIPVNTLALAGESLSTEEIEMGSQLGEHIWSMWVDFYAEDDVLGLHLIGDVKAILEGRMASIGRSRPNVEVMNYTQATPTTLFWVEIDNVAIDKGRIVAESWRRYWYGCAFDVIDTYANEDY